MRSKRASSALLGALIAVAVGLVVGTLLGLLAGSLRGWVDSVIMRAPQGLAGAGRVHALLLCTTATIKAKT